MKPRILAALAVCGTLGAATPVALYEFDDATQLGKATLGADLVIVGATPVHAASVTDGQASPATLDGVITTVQGTANRLLVTHGIGPNGGGTDTNQYTLLFDVLVPGAGQWRSFYQANLANGNDAEYFVRNSDNALGRGTIGYSSQSLQTNRWYRLAISVDLTTGGFFRTYLDGELFYTHTKPGLNGEYSLNPSQVILFGDNDNENHPLRVGLAAIYDKALDAAEISALGGPGLTVLPNPDNNPPAVTPEEAGPATAATGTPQDYTFTATDEDGDSVQIQADWGDGALSPWSGLAAAGSPAALSYAWSAPGSFTIRARARDAQGSVSPWVEIQDVTVTGPPIVAFSTPPYLQNMSPTGMTVMAELAEDIPLTLQYGATTEYGASAAFESVASGGGTWFIRAALSGLEPDTLYHYRLASTEGEPVTAGATFRTAPVAWKDFTFGALGDIQTTNGGFWTADPWEPAKIMLQHMADRGVSFGLGLGDHAQDGNSYTSTKNSHLNRTASILGTRVPFYIAWGNHDGNSPTHPLRLSADMPSRHRTDTFSTHTSGFGSFSFVHSGVFYVCLEHFSVFTGTHSFVNGSGNDVTNGWLDAQLSSPAAQNARFRIVAIHVPTYCERWIDGNAGLRANLAPRLEQYGVDLCLSGHMHGYERGLHNGVNYVIAGGGSYLDANEPLVANWGHLGGHIDVPGMYRKQSSPGVLGPPEPIKGGIFHHYAEFTVRENYLRMDIHGFNADGSYIDILDTLELGVDPGPDSDGDGLRDPWEIANGLDPEDPDGINGPGGDLDGDGQSNHAEFLAGTAANDPASVFRVVAGEVSAEGWEIVWSSVPGKRYRLLLSDDLGSWAPLQEGGQDFVIEASAGTTTSHVLTAPSEGQGFVRVEVVP